MIEIIFLRGDLALSLKTILFDLDGTLLPMDQDLFLKSYFKRLVQKLALHGYHPEKTVQAIMHCTSAMIKNDGSRTNEQAFWQGFGKMMGESCIKDEPLFDAFYRSEFQQVAADCGFTPKAAACIAALREKGLRLVLATNPFFPAVATESRIRWAGLDKSDFELVTTYENSRFCKPNPEYYRQIMRELDLKPEECLMVGNDVDEDMIAREVGMQVFLLTDCLINKNNADIHQYPHGSFDELLAFIG